MSAVGVHHPQPRRLANSGTTESNLPAVRGFNGAKVPDSGFVMGQRLARSIAWIKPADVGSSTSKFGFIVPIEMINVSSLRLILPCHFRAGTSTREQDLAVAGPCCQV